MGSDMACFVKREQEVSFAPGELGGVLVWMS